jgi:hypothetical protein
MVCGTVASKFSSAYSSLKASLTLDASLLLAIVLIVGSIQFVTNGNLQVCLICQLWEGVRSRLDRSLFALRLPPRQCRPSSRSW